jgi:2-polyprenyl-3-methyl-5-hydroxy-6-metoxy-1,4-benzoquinol methylase
MKKWYEELFENYADSYEKLCYTKGTLGEVDFIEKELGGDRARTILDIGCGTGRHAVELAKRGYTVTGFDLSETLIAKARSKAEAAGVSAEFIRADACTFRSDRLFDAAILMCEGAFPLMETDEMNYRILENAARALKPGGKFVFTTLNALFPLFHSVKNFLESNGQKTEELTFDLMTFREHSKMEIADDAGRPRTLVCNERYYTPPEITWLLKTAGFKTIAIHGAKLGQLSRADALTAEDFEMLVIAEK